MQDKSWWLKFSSNIKSGLLIHLTKFFMLEKLLHPSSTCTNPEQKVAVWTKPNHDSLFSSRAQHSGIVGDSWPTVSNLFAIIFLLLLKIPIPITCFHTTAFKNQLLTMYQMVYQYNLIKQTPLLYTEQLVTVRRKVHCIYKICTYKITRVTTLSPTIY